MNEWIESTFNVGGGVTQAIAVILALAVVLLLFGLFIFVLKRLTGANAPQSRNRQPRIALMDSATVDTRRRLVLVRRDNVEHLILIGGPTDVVVEQNIVRNAPLSAGRPGTLQGTQQNGLHAGTPSIKVPSAPGPDIPPTPADRVLETEPDASAPVAPAPAAPAPVTPARTATATAPAYAAPAPAEPASRQKTGEPPVAKAPSVGPAVPAANGDDVKAEKGADDGPAADPHRVAAPQPGFGRFASGSPAKTAAAGNQTERATRTAAVKTAPEPPKAAESDPANKPLSTLKSLTRSFTSHDRPNYGSQTITPPASGPAARAKTALLKPLEPTRVTGRVEPVVGDTPFKEEADSPMPAASGEPAPEDNSKLAGIAGPRAADSTGGGLPAEEPAEQQNLSEAQPAAGDKPELTSSASATLTPSVASPANGAGEKTSPEEPSASGLSSEMETASETTVKLDMEDLLEDLAPSPPPSRAAATFIAPPEETAAGQPEPQAREQAQAQLQNQAQIRDPQPEPGASKAPEVRIEPPPAQPAAKTAQGLGEKNPIEDEMAKILNELGGRQS